MSYRDQEEHLEIGEQKEGDGLLKSSKAFISLFTKVREKPFSLTINEKAWEWAG